MMSASVVRCVLGVARVTQEGLTLFAAPVAVVLALVALPLPLGCSARQLKQPCTCRCMCDDTVYVIKLYVLVCLQY